MERSYVFVSYGLLGMPKSTRNVDTGELLVLSFNNV